MTQHTGEDQRHLHSMLEGLRFASIIVLMLHYYATSCPECQSWQQQNPIIDRLLTTILDTPPIDSPLKTKAIALGLLLVSLLGARGAKEPTYTPAKGLKYLMAGIVLYAITSLFTEYPAPYFIFTTAGYLLILYAGAYLSRIIWRKPDKDTFNRLHESFPQEERLLENDYSLNLKARYYHENQLHNSWINIIDPFRGTLILGSPGSGKTWFLVEPLIKQYIKKGFALLVYDFKYDDLSRIVYNHFLDNRDKYPPQTSYYNLHFGDLDHSHRCNPLHPSTLHDLQDAGEAARAVIHGMTTEGSTKHGEFFLDSAINFVQALIWFLRLYENGRYCSWPHVIELAQVPYRNLFTILRAEPELRALLTPFVNALENAPKQLEGQIASAAIHLARLSSPSIYYIMSGDDFSLDLNNPEAPKLLTIGSNPQKTETYGPMIAAYINTINRLANKKHQHPLAEIFDEFSTVKVHTITRSLATGRSNKMAITICTQHASQLNLAYGRDFAEVILNTCGNIITGQTSGDTAKLLSDRFGKTMQDRESLTTTFDDLHITQSTQLEYAVPVNRIAALSSGEFVGMVADTPTQPIAIKTFCCRLINDPAALAQETNDYQPLPTTRETTPEELTENFHRIRMEIETLTRSELTRIKNSPELAHLVIESQTT
ncbi:MAG TPA: YWFCY domain-containing protein [Puia sp.]|nr:YWFCY domain-containing protein [Puia sp.]